MTSPTYDSRRDEAIAWLYARINYEATSAIPYSEQGMKLDRMRELARRLGNPHDRLPIVHIAGTKGKGSTAAMIAAALQSAGHSVGVYSSPHFDKIEERFAVGGAPCTAAELVALVEQVRPVAEAMDADRSGVGGPTFFDLTTAMALLHFAQRQVDFAVIEVGMGGRLDSTNIVTPLVSVITSISFDHTKQLGDTLGKIAAEKAGIIKPGVPVVSGVADGEAAVVIEQAARSKSARLSVRGRDFALQPSSTGYQFERTTQAGGAEKIDGVRPALPGTQHAENAATALATLGVLADGGARVPIGARLHGVETGRLPGRMERFPGKPLIVIDGAHNDASAAALAAAMDELCGAARAERVLVLAIAADKQIDAVARPLVEKVSAVVVTRFIENPRAVAPTELAKIVAQLAPDRRPIDVASDPAEALELARRRAPASGAVVLAGSLLFAAEARRLVVAQRGTPPR